MLSGLSAGSESATAPAPEQSLSAKEQSLFPADAAPEVPPSAEDFWGERAAAIHDAVQAPAGGWPSAGAAAADDARTATNAASGSCSSPTHGITRTPVSARGARARYHGLRSRPLAAAACLAILALAGFALALNPLGARTARREVVSGSKLPLASVLSDGVSRALARGLSRIGSPVAPHRALIARSARIRRRVAHTRPISRPMHAATPVASSDIVTAHPTAATYATHETPAAPAYTPSPPPASVSSSAARSSSSSAPVSATGASGALGPIQSPNG